MLRPQMAVEVVLAAEALVRGLAPVDGAEEGPRRLVDGGALPVPHQVLLQLEGRRAAVEPAGEPPC